MKLLIAVHLSILLTFAPTSLVAGEWVYDQQLGMGLSVPDGFVKDPKQVKGKVVFAFQRPPVGKQKMGTFILVSGLGGVLSREKLDPKEATTLNPQVTLVQEKWKEFEIEVFRVPEQAGDLDIITFNAQVPLKPEAVQIAVIGEAASENELRSVLRSVLADLKGQTNWLNTEQRLQRITPLGIMIGALLVIPVIVWRIVWKRATADGTEP